MKKEKVTIAEERITMAEWEQLAKEGIRMPIAVFTSGISMWPLLRAHEDYAVMEYPTRELRKGDIIVFHRTDGKEVAHRLCWMDETSLQTIGDNCDAPDAKFPRTSVAGLVTSVCRKGRTIHVDTRFWRFYGLFMIWSNPVRMFIRNKMFRPFRRFMIRVIKGKKK